MRDYQRELEAVTARLGEARPRLLLHSCCGPCSSYCLEYLTRWFRVDVLFYNPNILPEEEFHRRLYWQRRLLETAPFGRGVELLVPPRDEAAFRAAAGGWRGSRKAGPGVRPVSGCGWNGPPARRRPGATSTLPLP